MRNKTKKILKGTLIGALCGATLIGVGATINHFKADDDGLVKAHLSYNIGGLDANGAYEETDASIYTKDAFQAQGLKVTMDFDSNINYELFFYDQYGDFISSTGALDKNFDGEIPMFATHARIEITPKEDEDGIKWYEKNGYAKQMEVKVNEEQKEVNYSKNLFEYHGFGAYSSGVWEEKDPNGNTGGYYFSKDVDLTETTDVIVVVPTGHENMLINFYEEGSQTKVNIEPTSSTIDGTNTIMKFDCSGFAILRLASQTSFATATPQIFIVVK